LNDHRAADREISVKCSSRSHQYRPFTGIDLQSCQIFQAEGNISHTPWAHRQ
jgi:hypothetical protein